MKSLLSRINRIFCFYEHSYLFFLTLPESVRRKRTVRALTITSPPSPPPLISVCRVSMCEVPRQSRDNTHSWCLSLNCRGQCQYSDGTALLLLSYYVVVFYYCTLQVGGRDRSLLVSHLPPVTTGKCSRETACLLCSARGTGLVYNLTR